MLELRCLLEEADGSVPKSLPRKVVGVKSVDEDSLTYCLILLAQLQDLSQVAVGGFEVGVFTQHFGDYVWNVNMTEVQVPVLVEQVQDVVDERGVGPHAQAWRAPIAERKVDNILLGH